MKSRLFENQCSRCGNNLSESGSVRCKAFPLGIPIEIYAGKFDHRFSYPGDRGVRCQRIEPEGHSFCRSG